MKVTALSILAAASLAMADTASDIQTLQDGIPSCVSDCASDIVSSEGCGQDDWACFCRSGGVSDLQTLITNSGVCKSEVPPQCSFDDFSNLGLSIGKICVKVSQDPSYKGSGNSGDSGDSGDSSDSGDSGDSGKSDDADDAAPGSLLTGSLLKGAVLGGASLVAAALF